LKQVATFFFFLPLLAARAQSGSLAIEPFLRKYNHPAVQTIMSSPETYRLQIIYSYKNSAGKMERSSYRADQQYFYPASIIKLPMALLALEWLENEKYSPASRLQVYSGESSLCDDSVAHILEKMLVHSDNQSYDCLLALVNHSLPTRLAQAGFVRIRLARPFLLNGTMRWKISAPGHQEKEGLYKVRQTPHQRQPPDCRVGQASLQKGQRKEEAHNFCSDNYFPLDDVHKMLEALIWPESSGSFFNISKAAHSWLLARLRMLPRESRLKTKEWRCNTYQKFFFRHRDCRPLPRGIQVAGKGGMAYGFLSDASIIVSNKQSCQLILSAAIYVNSNQVVGDDRYDYEKAGFPFLFHIGQAFLKHACSQKNAERPQAP
jgi:hypothetical protein